MDRFLLAENVNKGADSPLYILQTIKHEMLIEIVSYDYTEELNYSLSDVFDFFEYINPDGLTEYYMLIVRKFYHLTEGDIDVNIDNIRGQIVKAWKWYKSYLMKEDSIIDKKHGTNNPDLN